MATSCNQFFGIQELVDNLTPLLTQQDLSRLTRTCRRIHISCTPAFYRELIVLYPHRRVKVFNSTTGLVALGRNVQHVKKVFFGLEDMAYFYNCVLAFEDLQSHTSTDTPTPQRPSWLPGPDETLTNTPELVPLPPITNLVNLSLAFEVAGKAYTPPSAYKIPSAVDFGVMTAQLCWMLSLNQHLTRLHLGDIHSTGIQGFRRLCRTLAGMTKLQELIVSLPSLSFVPDRWLFDLFFSCPPSVQRLLILPFEGDTRSLTQPSHDGTDNEELIEPSWRRQGFLDKLESLRLWEFDEEITTLDIQQVFAHCPNIKSLFLPPLTGLRDIDVIGEYVGKKCPKITTLSYRGSEVTDSAFLPFRIVDALPAQKLEEFEYKGSFRDLEGVEDNLYLLRRHFAALRRVDIDQSRCSFVSRIPVAFILKECSGLEDLAVSRVWSGYYVDLEDLTDQEPWVCSRLKRLELSINGCELPNPPMELKIAEPCLGEPYYSRPNPLTICDIEVAHFAQLEVFYRKIGALTSLQYLVLRMARLDERSRYLYLKRDGLYSFPALLSLPKPEGGGGGGGGRQRRPAYLQHWARLKDLRTLQGSFRADTLETKVTAGWDEVRFMREHWPRLSYANFFSRRTNVTEPFRWLEENSVKNGRLSGSLYF
ncbi:MAG: hypothetical protein JOS17DRAFT_743966 [Linnemannia elongata]|nr:MAG: hypothetical protein JOS17DRAFT_743966 [Linnemannia elongata]